MRRIKQGRAMRRNVGIGCDEARKSPRGRKWGEESRGSGSWEGEIAKEERKRVGLKVRGGKKERRPV